MRENITMKAEIQDKKSPPAPVILRTPQTRFRAIKNVLPALIYFRSLLLVRKN